MKNWFRQAWRNELALLLLTVWYVFRSDFPQLGVFEAAGLAMLGTAYLLYIVKLYYTWQLRKMTYE